MSCTLESLSDADVVRRQDDVEMMKRPHLWPCGRLLPLKRRGWTLDSPHDWLGVLVDQADDRWTVYKGLLSMFDPFRCDHEDYDSPEAIVAAGWTVD